MPARIFLFAIYRAHLPVIFEQVYKTGHIFVVSPIRLQRYQLGVELKVVCKFKSIRF